MKVSCSSAGRYHLPSTFPPISVPNIQPPVPQPPSHRNAVKTRISESPKNRDPNLCNSYCESYRVACRGCLYWAPSRSLGHRWWVSGGWSVNLLEKIWKGLKCQLFNVESTRSFNEKWVFHHFHPIKNSGLGYQLD